VVYSTPTPHHLDAATTGDDWAELRTYHRAKQVVARQIRAISEFFHTHHDEQGESDCRELMVKLAEDRFTLAVVGQFKRGKSSLMNAIIGRELLPTGVLPVTSVVTILRFGPRERVVIPRSNVLLSETAPVSALPEYVTQEGNPGNRKQIQAVYVELPQPFLRRGVEFVDTPGIGSSVDANTATTIGFLPRCDAAVLVTSVDAPMTAVETQFLDEIQRHAEKLFFVVNKIDLLEEQEREKLLSYVSGVIRQHTRAAEPRLFPVSCRLGLKARLDGDSDGYALSGLAALEQTLARFLSSERSDALLLAVLNKSLRLTEQYPELAGIEKRLKRLRDIIARHQASEATLREAVALEPAPREGEAEPVGTSAKPSDTSDLLAGMATRGCPVCDHLADVAFRFFAQWQFDLASDEQVQLAFADELGFCPLHTWQLADLASPQGLSTGLPRLLERLSLECSELAASSRDIDGFLAKLKTHPKTCRVCSLLRAAEQDYAARLAASLTDPPTRQAYGDSQGTCLRHLGLLLTATSDPEVRSFLLADAARHFEQWTEDMQTYAMKRDALRGGLLNTDEENAYLLALVHLAGSRRLCLPRAEDHP